MNKTLTAADIPWNGAGQSVRTSVPVVKRTLRDTLHDTEIFIRKYVVLSDEQAIAVTLWAAHTHVIDAAECTPYVQITSATKRAGKTRLLEVLEPLVARPWLTGRVSHAVLTRKIDAEKPTLLLDETDAAFNGEKEYAEALRGILNTGYRRSGKASLCVGQGAGLSYKDFSTYAAKAFAGIGALPGTIADRSIPIKLKRRSPGERCARWRERDGHAEAASICHAFAAWGGSKKVLEVLTAARPELPVSLSDRQADVWEPLLAIAELAGGDWPKKVQAAAVTLAGAIDDADIVVDLLRDIYDVLRDGRHSFIPTKELLEKLVAADDRPWATWGRQGKGLTARGLARLLDPLEIHPARLEQVRGYRPDAFEDAIARYLPSYVSLRQPTNETGPESPISSVSRNVLADACESPKEPDFIDEMTLGHIESRDRGKGRERV